MYQYEVITIAKTVVDMCESIEVYDECGRCPLKEFCQKHNNNWESE